MLSRVLLGAVCAGGLAASAAPAQAAFPGANGRIAFERVDGDNIDVWTMRPDGSDQRNLTPATPGIDGVPSWSADGRKLVFVSDRKTRGNPEGDFEVFVINADGSGTRQVTFNTQMDDWPAWSPDGDQIVFYRWYGEENLDVMTIRANGSGERNLTRSPGVWEHDAVWSPDGRELAFAKGMAGSPNDIYTMRPDGSHVRQLTFTPDRNEQRPDWSPDGRRIAFNGDARDGNYEVYAIDEDGGHRENLSNAPASGDGAPAWSPNGRKLVFGSNRDGGVDLFTMRIDGSRQINRTRSAAEEGAPDWQPLPGGRDLDDD